MVVNLGNLVHSGYQENESTPAHYLKQNKTYLEKLFFQINPTSTSDLLFQRPRYEVVIMMELLVVIY